MSQIFIMTSDFISLYSQHGTENSNVKSLLLV